MFDPTEPRLFALPVGVDFPTELIGGLADRLKDAQPEKWARVTIYVNTARMRARLKEQFAKGPPRLLPRIRLITDLGLQNVTIPAEIPPLHVRLQLSQLVTKLLDQDPSIAPRSAIYDLSESLAALMEEMQTEGVTPDDLAALDMGDHSAHWQRSLSVLRIITGFFTDDTGALPGKEARLRQVILTLAEHWRDNPPNDPVIVAGSTGSRGATRLFMQLVAGLPQGAVVLPGFDFDQPASVWDHMTDALTAEDHPQFRFRVVADDLGVAPTQVRRWTETQPLAPARNRLVSLALRPAPVTDQWRSEGAELVSSLPEATRNLTLIQAPNQRIEANAIALCLRAAVARNQTAALVTPDRILTRQVTAALDRWAIIPDDSAGTPLNQTPPGRLLRHVLSVLLGPLALDQCLVLMKHPLFDYTKKRGGIHLLWTRELELYLRRNSHAFPTAEHVRAWLATGPQDDAKTRWAEWIIAHLLCAPAPTDRPLADHLTHHIALTETLAGGPDGAGAAGLWDKDAGAAARSAMDALTTAAPHGGTLSAHDYASFFTAYIGKQVAQESILSHPDIKIWGTLEARVSGVDVMVLGGLNDGSWPELPGPDPWLNRQMHKNAGLLLPERRVGLQAHDFQQAAGAKHVILSRSLKVSDTETVPSRWINRLGNLLRGLGDGGKSCMEDMTARGAEWINQAIALEHPEDIQEPATRPSPRPPSHQRPKELSVTAITRLIRDPYSIYAQYVLRLFALSPLNPVPEARLRGDLLHGAMRRVIREGHPLPKDIDVAKEALMCAFDTELALNVPWPSMAALWRSRFAALLPGLLVREMARARNGLPVLTETKHGIALKGMDFTLTAKPDRIDRLHDDSFAVLDYKSSPPTPAEVAAFDKQLPLQSAMLERGAFGPLGMGHVSEMTYIGLGSKGEDVTVPMEVKESDRRLPDLTWDGLQALIRAYSKQTKGYTARRANKATSFEGDYDHLSRYGEWSEIDTAVAKDMPDE